MALKVTIGEDVAAFVERLVESGRYSTASEVVSDALYYLEERELAHEAKLTALRAEIQKGIDSGPAEPVGDMFARIKAEGRQRLASKNAK